MRGATFKKWQFVRMHLFLWMLLTAGATFCLAQGLQSEDFADKGGWTGKGAGSQWLNTNFAGGSSPGEASIQISEDAQYYFADLSIGVIDLSKPFGARGRISWRLNNAMKTPRGVHFGFFDQDSFSSVFCIGFHTDNNARAFVLHETTAGGIAVNKQGPLGKVITGTSAAPNNDQSYAFDMRWEPDGSGGGKWTVRLGGVGEAALDLTSDEVAYFSGQLDAFGFFVPTGRGGAGAQFFADDLQYSVGGEAQKAPEEAALDMSQAPRVTPKAAPLSASEQEKQERFLADLESIRHAARAWRPGGDAPTVNYFLTRNIPTQDPDTLLLPYDAPAITNNRLWAQAVNSEGRSGILDMDDVWAGSEVVEGTMRYTLQGRWGGNAPLLSTMVVKVNGQAIAPPPVEKADWMPNTVIRHAETDGIKYTGTVKAAAGHMALLKSLKVENVSGESRTLNLEFVTSPASGRVAAVARPDREENWGYHYDNVTFEPGQSREYRFVLAYRYSADEADAMASDFDAEWELADAYWNALLADAYAPQPGPFLSGGVPIYETTDLQRRRFYDFGVATALMVMTNGPDRMGETNLYQVAMPDAPYSIWVYFWDTSYAAETLALMDPDALRTTLKYMCRSGIQNTCAFFHTDGKSANQWYAANFSSFVRLLKAYVDWTGDLDILETEVAGKTVMEHTLAASEFHDNARPQRDGLFHANTEHHLFDRNTVKGYEHYVAFPNMGDVWGKRQIARLLEHQGQAAQAAELRAKADARAQAVIEQLYNEAPGYKGTWKQIHEDGQVLQIRHGIDFMHGGVALHDDLSAEKKEAMHQWWREQILGQTRPGDIWVISQDRRDGNNGPHQMEHNGQGAYPGWPYHYAWSLHEMGYLDSVAELLDTIKPITQMGAIGQGYSRDGRRSRSGWVEIAGAFPVPYILNFMFGLQPRGEELQASPNPELSRGARLIGLRWHGKIYEIDASGNIEKQ